jgi:endogenous inhibitor of DNA gyrase (YacG/DUF329 family)
MVTIQCDTCGQPRIRDNAEQWILGFDVPAASAPMRRSITFLERWQDRRVLDPGATHFCCAKCRDIYLENAQAA